MHASEVNISVDVILCKLRKDKRSIGYLLKLLSCFACGIPTILGFYPNAQGNEFCGVPLLKLLQAGEERLGRGLTR
jgi:hypothetical protein